MSIRDLRNRARGSLHKALSIPAVYITPTGDASDCSVRVHHRIKPFGDMTGFDYQPAERVTTVPEIVSLAAEVTPTRRGVFSIAADEAYRVESVFPRDGLTITTQVTRLDQADIDAGSYPVPGSV